MSYQKSSKQIQNNFSMVGFDKKKERKKTLSFSSFARNFSPIFVLVLVSPINTQILNKYLPTRYVHGYGKFRNVYLMVRSMLLMLRQR